ncbi:TonB-dependent receptor plug domain-containing protein [Microbulbifer yueqingensis]|uniref:Iron complex outermembrane recepter protein n=1 Tax=Microbulbifer yueqingensis TaxID=658219 RepID=A0A1G8VQH0_9GAMM|nr:TonB-dependent receptor [Microbulbifer yueqingensis]SDJ68193.1 iron complex outermembrane recepter protein [Microbulbifer yueqingensis]
MRKNLLSVAVKGAIGLTAAAVMVPAMPAFAQGDATLVEEIVVTGSRIKRTNFDQSAQVVSMDRQAIDATGSLMISDTLRSTPLNSLGSFNERSGSSAQSNATINLRGLGAQRSLVMINGRRMPGSPNLGAASVNLNMIPMTAVERIDILADGASAVYGSDAVAGVVNLMMRENFEGLEFTARRGERANDDGIEESFGFISGITSDRGNVTFAAEYNRRDPIFDADRDYTAAWIRDDGDGRLDSYVDTDGYSYYGKSIQISDPNTKYYDIQAANGCADDSAFLETGALAFDEPEGTLCNYNYANISANKAELNRVNTFLSANYDISESVEFFTNILFSKVDSFGRYAPPAAKWEDMPADYRDVPFDVDALLASGDITEDYEITGYYRWTNIGPRDNFVTDTQYDFTAGFRGDLANGVSYETYAQKGRYESKENGMYYLSYPGLDYILAQGKDPFSAEGAAAMRATTSQDNFTSLSKVYGHLQFDAGDWFGAGETIVLSGAEAYQIEYANQYDAASEAGLVGGSSGNSAAGERDVAAVFAEAIIPVTDLVEMNAAVRYDNYSDFGSNVAPSLSATYNVTDTLSLRARAGKGFRAPALDELYGPSAFSAESATDPASGVYRQWDTYYSTNEDLDAETSTSLSIGGNWEFVSGWSLDVGVWNVEVEDVIVQPSTQEIFWARAGGVALDPSTGIYVSGTGADTEVFSKTTNAGILDVTGVDVKLDGGFDTEFGMITVGGLVSQQLSYEKDAFYLGPVQDVSTFNLYPDMRGQFMLGWSMGMHAVDLTVDYVSAHDELTEIADSGSLSKSGEDLDDWTTLNLAYRLDTASFGSIKVGARNLTNEDPVLDKDGKFAREHFSLYDNTGRTVYAEYTMSF